MHSIAFFLTFVKLLKGALLSITCKLPISGSASGPGGKERPLVLLRHMTNTNTASIKSNTNELETSISQKVTCNASLGTLCCLDCCYL